MKNKQILILLFFFIASLGCSKQEKSSNKGADSLKSSGSVPTENVETTKQITSQPVKSYKKGEPIELYDLIYMFLPDENETGDWDKISKIDCIKWGKKDCRLNDCSQTGDLRITVNGKKFKSEWWVWFEGKESNWMGFSITYTYNSSDNFDLIYTIDLNTLLNHQNFTSIIIEGGGGSDLPYITYEMNIPSKKKFWMKVQTEGGNGKGGGIWSFYIKCSLNINEIDKL